MLTSGNKTPFIWRKWKFPEFTARGYIVKFGLWICASFRSLFPCPAPQDSLWGGALVCAGLAYVGLPGAGLAWAGFLPSLHLEVPSLVRIRGGRRVQLREQQSQR